MTDARRKTWWKESEIIVWIAFRNLKAVEWVSRPRRTVKDGGRTLDTLHLALARSALLRPYAKPKSWLDRERNSSAGEVLRQARDEWAQAEGEIKLRNGSARRESIQKRWPPHAQEGRAAGRSINSHYSPADVDQLVERLICSKRDMTHDDLRGELFNSRYRKETGRLFALASERAEQRIALAEMRCEETDCLAVRWSEADRDAVEQFSARTAEACRSNLRSWFARTQNKAERRWQNEQDIKAAQNASAHRQAQIEEKRRVVEAQKR